MPAGCLRQAAALPREAAASDKTASAPRTHPQPSITPHPPACQPTHLLLHRNQLPLCISQLLLCRPQLLLQVPQFRSQHADAASQPYTLFRKILILQACGRGVKYIIPAVWVSLAVWPACVRLGLRSNAEPYRYHMRRCHPSIQLTSQCTLPPTSMHFPPHPTSIAPACPPS